MPFGMPAVLSLLVSPVDRGKETALNPTSMRSRWELWLSYVRTFWIWMLPYCQVPVTLTVGKRKYKTTIGALLLRTGACLWSSGDPLILKDVTALLCLKSKLLNEHRGSSIARLFGLNRGLVG